MTQPRVATGIVVVDEEGRILCLRRHPEAVTGPNDWAIPGGKLEPGETLADCAVRELREETGIEASDVVRLNVVTEDMAWGEDNHYVTLYFLATAWSGEARVLEEGKHTDLYWIDPKDVSRHAGDTDGDMTIFEPLAAFCAAGGMEEVLDHLEERASIDRMKARG